MKLTDKGFQDGGKTRFFCFTKTTLCFWTFFSAFQQAIFADRRSGLRLSRLKIPSCKALRTEVWSWATAISLQFKPGVLPEKEIFRNPARPTFTRWCPTGMFVGVKKTLATIAIPIVHPSYLGHVCQLSYLGGPHPCRRIVKVIGTHKNESTGRLHLGNPRP